MDPTQIVALLQGILSTGAQPVAILSLLANVYLWRAVRASDKQLMDSRVEEIARMRAELDRLRTTDSNMVRQLDLMARQVTTSARGGDFVEPRRGRTAYDDP